MDLLNNDQVEQFNQSIRDITDTFFKYPVVIRQDGVDTQLSAGIQEGRSGKESDSDGERIEVEDYREEVSEWKTLRFSNDYLDELAVIIGYDDSVFIDGKRYSVITITDQAYFRDDKLVKLIEIAR